MISHLVDVGKERSTLESRPAVVQEAVNNATNAAMEAIKAAGLFGHNSDPAERLAGAIIYYMRESVPTVKTADLATAEAHYTRDRKSRSQDWNCECVSCRIVRTFHAFTFNVPWLPIPKPNR